MHTTPRGERLQIGIFGNRNAGKSSLINALAGQALSIVSDVAGTTTDPVAKAMELLPLGPVTLVDTAGLDDDASDIGRARVARTLVELPKSDLVIAVIDATKLDNERECETLAMLVEAAAKNDVPLVIALNKCDDGVAPEFGQHAAIPFVVVSAQTGRGIPELKQAIIAAAADLDSIHPLAWDLVPAGGTALLVTPIDSAAPKGRMILPQVQVLRDLLDHDVLVLFCKENEVASALGRLAAPPEIVITDSQAFRQVAAAVPASIPLTSFSILFARYKGDLAAYVDGVRALETVADGDHVLVAESCTHHVQSDDIGTVKIPRWLGEKTGKKIIFEKCAGRDFPADLKKYKAIIQCGGCMITPRETRERIRIAQAQGVPITNYGIMIAWNFGILDRALAPFTRG